MLLPDPTYGSLRVVSSSGSSDMGSGDVSHMELSVLGYIQFLRSPRRDAQPAGSPRPVAASSPVASRQGSRYLFAFAYASVSTPSSSSLMLRVVFPSPTGVPARSSIRPMKPGALFSKTLRQKLR